jgi:hypothetical protein
MARAVFAQGEVHAGLVARPLALKPGEKVSNDTQRQEALDGAIKELRAAWLQSVI